MFPPDKHYTRTAMNAVARIWPIVLKAGSTKMTSFKHVPHVFSKEELALLILPIREKRTGDQKVALVGGIHYQREVTESLAQKAYNEHHRTRVYESIETRSDGWFSLAALQFARLSRYGVVCTVYESNSGDDTLIPHFDQWFSVILQKEGSKKWTLWEGDKKTQLITHPGDILLMPSNIKHIVETPKYSVHMVFAFLTNEPISTLK